MRLCRFLVPLAALAIFAAAAPADPPDAATSPHYSRWPKVRLGGVAVGAGFGYTGFGYPGVGFAPYRFPVFYDDFAWLPPAYFYQETMGDLKIRDADPTAAVYIDGGFAGTAGHLKSMWVEPGVHIVRIAQGERSFEQKVYVLTGKTITVNAAFASESNLQGSRP